MSFNQEVFKSLTLAKLVGFVQAVIFVQSQTKRKVYILVVYTSRIHKMDIYETTILCNECKQPTERSYIVKDGFKIRSWKCPECDKQWDHPADIEEYKKFNQLRNKDFTVKLRHVGNSYAVSIPKEIIQFTEVRKEGRIVRMNVEGPERVSITFTKITKKVIRGNQDERN